jgi:hypothetical protein
LFGGLEENGSRFRAMAHLIDDKTVAKMGYPKLDVSHPASGDVDCRCFVAGGYEVESWVVSSKSFPYLLALINASAFPGTNTLNRNSAVSSLKTLRSEEALGLPCSEANYPTPQALRLERR